jgi:hypothetical protein
MKQSLGSRGSGTEGISWSCYLYHHSVDWQGDRGDGQAFGIDFLDGIFEDGGIGALSQGGEGPEDTVCEAGLEGGDGPVYEGDVGLYFDEGRERLAGLLLVVVLPGLFGLHLDVGHGVQNMCSGRVIEPYRAT